jgi:hypothetical protein
MCLHGFSQSGQEQAESSSSADSGNSDVDESTNASSISSGISSARSLAVKTALDAMTASIVAHPDGARTAVSMNTR